MLRLKPYFLLSLSLFILIGCSKKPLLVQEEKPLGIMADADSIIVFQYSVDNLTDSLTPNNLIQVKYFYYDTVGYLHTEKIIGLTNGNKDYESVCKISRDVSHQITQKSTHLKDRFDERNIIETYLKRGKIDQVIETKYYIAKKLIACDTLRISYFETRTLKEACKNTVWSKISEQVYGDNKLKASFSYIGANIMSSTEYTYDENDRLRTSRDFVHNAENETPIPQPSYTHTYILGKDGNPMQQVTVLGGSLLSISKVEIYHRTK